MRLVRPRPRCHWSHISRRTAAGREIRTKVWICEYPYRTMLTSPCDCEGSAPAARPATAQPLTVALVAVTH